MKTIVTLIVGVVIGAVGMTLVSQDTYNSAKKETRTHIDSAVGSAATAAHTALNGK